MKRALCVKIVLVVSILSTSVGLAQSCSNTLLAGDECLFDDVAEQCCELSTDCNCGQRSGFIFGYDFVFVQPRFIESFDVQVTNPVSQSATLLPLDFDLDLSPRYFVGYKTKKGFGVRARYWRYDDTTTRTLVSGPAVLSVHQLTSVFPATIAAIGGDTLSVANTFKTDTVDIEGFYDFRPGNFEIAGSLGFRYAELNQRRRAEVTGGFPQALDFMRDYKGFGILAGVDGRRPIGCSGLAVVFQGRGSVVHGDKTLNRSVTGMLPPALPAPPPTPPLVSLEDAYETSLIGELGIGLELRRRFGCHNLYARVMYENRFWTAASTPALGLSGFEGFSSGVGISY